MIKRVIGLLAAVAVIAIIVFATLNRDKYRSMLEERGTQKRETRAAEPARRVQPTHDAQPAQLYQNLQGDSLRLEQ